MTGRRKGPRTDGGQKHFEVKSVKDDYHDVEIRYWRESNPQHANVWDVTEDELDELNEAIAAYREPLLADTLPAAPEGVLVSGDRRTVTFMVPEVDDPVLGRRGKIDGELSWAEAHALRDALSAHVTPNGGRSITQRIEVELDAAVDRVMAMSADECYPHEIAGERGRALGLATALSLLRSEGVPAVRAAAMARYWAAQERDPA
jgi:hypothetical protein